MNEGKFDNFGVKKNNYIEGIIKIKINSYLEYWNLLNPFKAFLCPIIKSICSFQHHLCNEMLRSILYHFGKHSLTSGRVWQTR